VSQQSLSVNGKRNNITRDDLLSVAKQMNIKKSAKILGHINDIVNKWPQFAEEIMVNSALRDAINKTLINYAG
jgi:serine/threonine-protein kinase HipA